ncbi:hypothetical protein MMC11_002549 [Xylographa trunciseda]|nr:hypothetical protein [Xylographa trunciseda]
MNEHWIRLAWWYILLRYSFTAAQDDGPGYAIIHTWATLEFGDAEFDIPSELVQIPACFPDNFTSSESWYNNRDLSAPCNVLPYFFYNCTWGIAPPPPNWDRILRLSPVPNATQQQCYCSSTYWEYVSGCNNCFRLHGGAQNALGWVPEQYISAQSSTYCSNPVTAAFYDFVTQWVPATTITSVANATSTIGLQNTNVSLYFTPTVTATIPTQTGQIGVSATTTTISSTGKTNAAAWLGILASLSGTLVMAVVLE